MPANPISRPVQLKRRRPSRVLLGGPFVKPVLVCKAAYVGSQPLPDRRRASDRCDTKSKSKHMRNHCVSPAFALMTAAECLLQKRHPGGAFVLARVSPACSPLFISDRLDPGGSLILTSDNFALAKSHARGLHCRAITVTVASESSQRRQSAQLQGCGPLGPWVGGVRRVLAIVLEIACHAKQLGGPKRFKVRASIALGLCRSLHLFFSTIRLITLESDEGVWYLLPISRV